MWDNVYDTDNYVYGKQPNDFLKLNYSKMPKGKVLCLAEGEGRNAVFLAKQGYQITAVDNSKVGLEKAAKLAAENKVKIETICADLADFDLGEKKWDAIVSIYCHLPANLRQRLYQKVQVGLKPNGCFLLEGYTPKQLDYKTGGPPNVDMMLSASVIEKELPSLHFELLHEIEREVIEGEKHTGLAHVVQVIAFKNSVK